MTTDGHLDPLAPTPGVGAPKLFTVGAAGTSLRPAAPPMNNFG
ncbi:MAG TPA: hypothetical protein VG077_13190 [Verrucomicrobiae bacterium]|nr:hypothetical protein [Verrucomicrobiae bacterium]